jgi:glutamate--cysteine ligase
LKIDIEKRVSQLLDCEVRNILKDRKIGLEKESLRVGKDGYIAQTPHPVGLGSALTHPSITTDYSEALLELVTPPFNHFSDTLKYLDDTHRYVYSQLDNEILWATSMPCVVDGDPSVPIAQYGSSNAGKMKTAYRRGLGHRYGRMMQAIAGVHFNYSYPETFWERLKPIYGHNGSMQDFMSQSYIGMVRNLQRVGWLVPYLFGASPAICGSFLGARPTRLQPLMKHSYFNPYATSLRVGDIGYQNSKEGEAGININYDSLQSYVDSLGRAIETPSDDYRKFGLEVDGEWQQLNYNTLQIENEYYSSVRPKQILQGEEKPTLALARRGIAYIELRSVDVNLFEPLGINEEQMRFLESFLLYSVMSPSAPYGPSELSEITYNINTVAERGRDPKLKLKRDGKSILLRDWANEIFDHLSMGCELLDLGDTEHTYCRALQHQRVKVEDSDLTPSAKILTEMIDNKEEFFNYSLRMSKQHQEWFCQRPLDAETQQTFKDAAKQSITRQHEIEASDTQSFEQFLKSYFAQK